MENVIEIENLCKSYDGFSLDNVSLCVPAGSITGFIGQNGAGKTTTIYSLLNIINTDSGNIRIFGMDYREKETEIKERIGIVFDEMGYHDSMTPFQLNRMMKNVYHNWQEDVFFQYLERFGLPARKKCGKFSRGMRMKLQIAVALSHKADLLILDEPTGGLDPIVRNEMLNIFQTFMEEENHTVFLSSHIISDLERIADEITFIDKGRILLSDNKDKILEQHGLLKVKKADLDRVDKADIIAVKKSTYGAEILVKNRSECHQKYPDLLMDSPTLEEIMLFYVTA